MKKKSNKSGKSGGSKLKIVNVKISVTDRNRMVALAKRFAAGNLSAWIRHAGRMYTPKKGEKIELKAA